MIYSVCFIIVRYEIIKKRLYFLRQTVNRDLWLSDILKRRSLSCDLHEINRR